MSLILPGEPPRSPRARAPGLALLWLAALLPAASALRAGLTVRFLGDSAGCSACLALPVLGHDAQLIAPAWLLLALALATRGRVVAWLCAAPVILLLWLMALDVAILTTLGMRLYLFDVLKFGGEGAAIGDFVLALLRSSGRLWLLLAMLALLLPLLALRRRTPRPRAARTLAAAAVLGAAAALAARMQDPGYIYADAWLNLAELHLAQDVNEPYSAAFVRGLAMQPQARPAAVCTTGQARRPDVLVLAVESLSSYQSALHGGPFDFTPELDSLARRGTWFANFLANGFSTDAGLIALLTGRAPVPAVGRYRSIDAFEGFDDAQRSVAAVLSPAGYEVAFFTTGDLGFLDKGPWLDALGFDHWEGAEHPFYQGWPRGGFNAAEDRALYLRLLQWLQQRDATRPAFGFALTVQSHPPFIDPASGRLDEASVFRAVDRELGEFVRALERIGYFERGILLITGDHRSMTPLRPEERATHGDLAFARVPMVVLGNAGLPPGRIDLPFSHTDLLPSLRDLVAEQVCARADEGRFLRPEPLPPAWILHARGDVRNRVDVVYDGGRAALLLAGDDSRWLGTPPPQAAAIAAAIHLDRIERGALDSDISALIRILGR